MSEISLENLIKLQEAGQVDEALKLFAREVDTATDGKQKALALLGMITCHLMENRLRDAARTLDEVKRLGLAADDDVSLLLAHQTALLLIAEGKVRQGLRQFAFILQRYPRLSTDPSLRDLYEDIQQRRAFALVSSGQFHDALPILEECRSFSFDQPIEKERVLLSLGACEYELGRYGAAKKVLIEIIQYKSNTKFEMDARFRLAAINFEEGALAQAKLHLEEVVQSFGTPTEPDIPRQSVDELFSKTCKFLNEGWRSS